MNDMLQTEEVQTLTDDQLEQTHGGGGLDWRWFFNRDWSTPPYTDVPFAFWP